jgi:hypothetical protein
VREVGGDPKLELRPDGCWVLGSEGLKCMGGRKAAEAVHVRESELFDGEVNGERWLGGG